MYRGRSTEQGAGMMGIQLLPVMPLEAVSNHTGNDLGENFVYLPTKHGLME